jgi:hypothetical protein
MSRIEILAPADNTVFDIAPGTAVQGPQMPVINARAIITGEAPDPTRTTRFVWTVTIRFQASGCLNGRAREINDSFQLTSVGGDCAIVFPHVRGGELIISASADLPTICLESRTHGLSIRGTNPFRAELNAACGGLNAQRIAAHESGQRQFIGAVNGGTGTCPLFSGDRLGGVGLFQITRPAPSDDEHWDWRANVTRGLQIFAQKRAAAADYPRRVRQSAGFRALVNRFNAGRPTPAVIVLPDYSAQQLELDSIRGYNGWAGHDAFGMELHEFRVPLDAAGNLVVDVDAATGRGTIQWDQVPAAARPQNTGDPNYVNHVLAAHP